MEVLQTVNYYIFVKNEKTLWWNRTTSEFSIKAGKSYDAFDFIKLLINMKIGRIIRFDDIQKIFCAVNV